MSTDLAIVSTSVDLPDLGDVAAEIASLVAEHNFTLLDEVHRRAEAQSLYEHRSGNAERERHFAKLRLLAEAGIGVLSFDEPSLIEAPTKRSTWRTLAAAFERKRLLECCDRGTESGIVAYSIRDKGYTYVSGSQLGVKGSVPWSRARGLAVAQGIAFESLPPDTAIIRKRTASLAQTRARMRHTHEAAQRLARMRRTKHIAAAARAKGPKLAAAYALLRKTLQALHEAQDEFTREERGEFDFNYAFTGLYDVEDALGDALRVPE